MNAAILCPGPSLRQNWFDTPRTHDFVMAVNRAALQHDANWWVFTDHKNYVDPLRRSPYKSRVFSSRVELETVRRRCPEIDGLKPLAYEDVFNIVPQSIQWCTWSKTSAMALAYYLGARLIDVFGDDMAGTADYDGHTDVADTRDAQRWEREGVITKQVVNWLTDNGATVRRIASY